MKRSYFNLYLIVLIVLCSFSSCKKEKLIELGSYVLKEKYYLTEDTTRGFLNMNMEIELPVKYSNLQVLNEIRNNIIRNIFGERYIEISNDNMLPQFADDMEKEYKATNLPFVNEEEIGFAFNNDYELEGFTLTNDGKIYVYGVSLYVYMGGAHGLRTVSYSNYDVQTGSIITQEDLFTLEGLKALPLIMKNNILASNEEINSMEELNKYYWTEHILPNNNFYIHTDGITFLFNPYEIAPYAVGHTETAFTFEELKPFLKENTIISYLIK